MTWNYRDFLINVQSFANRKPVRTKSFVQPTLLRKEWSICARHNSW